MTGLFLSQLTLSHFRSHRRSVIDCDARPVALHGPNGAGKTNILEAVSLFSPGRGLRRSSAQDMTRRPEALGWKVTGILHAQRQVHEVEIWSENGAARQTRIDAKAAAQNTLGRIARVLWLVPAMDRLWIEGADGRRRFLDRMTLSFLPDHGDQTLRYEKAMRERNRLLKDMVREPSWYLALENAMAEAGAAIHANRLNALQAIARAQEEAEAAKKTAAEAAAKKKADADAAKKADASAAAAAKAEGAGCCGGGAAEGAGMGGGALAVGAGAGAGTGAGIGAPDCGAGVGGAGWPTACDTAWPTRVGSICMSGSCTSAATTASPLVPAGTLPRWVAPP